MGWIIDILDLMKNSYIAIRVDGVDFHDVIKIGLRIENDVPKKCR